MLFERPQGFFLFFFFSLMPRKPPLQKTKRDWILYEFAKLSVFSLSWLFCPLALVTFLFFELFPSLLLSRTDRNYVFLLRLHTLLAITLPLCLLAFLSPVIHFLPLEVFCLSSLPGMVDFSFVVSLWS